MIVEFLIAFFGGLLLLGKCIASGSSSYAMRREDEAWEAVRRPLTERLRADEEDDRAVAEMASWSTDDLYAYIGDDLLYVFGPEYKKLVPFDDRRYRNFGNFWNPYIYRRKREFYTREAYVTYWITHLLYAKRGKLKSIWNAYGLHVCVGNPEINFRMCERIEKCLRENGADVHLKVELETWVTNHNRKSPSHSVMARETRRRSWEGADLSEVQALTTIHPEYP